MQTANEKLADLAISHQIYLQRYGGGVVRRFMQLLNRVDDDLFARLTEALERLPPESFTVQRLDQMLVQVQRLNAEAYRAAGEELDGALLELAGYEASYQHRVLQSVLPAKVADALVLSTVSPNQVYAAAMARPFQGKLLKEALKDIETAKAIRIRDAIRMGFVEGETIGQMVRRLRGTRALKYADGLMEIDRRGAEALVRTAVNHTANYARQAVYEANADIVKEVQWLSALDGRTTVGCAALSGKTFPVGSGPRPPRHWNCLPGDSRVLARSKITGAFKRWFDGEVVVIKTASGRELTSTPNHPILTGSGWVASGILNVGDSVVCDGGSEWAAVVNSDHQDVPASIEHVTSAFFASSKMMPMPVPLAAEDFHGDGGGSEVAIVATDSLLRRGDNSSVGEHFRKFEFKLGCPSVSAFFVSFRHLAKRILGRGAASRSFVGGQCQRLAFSFGCSGHSRELLLRSVAGADFAPGKDGLNSLDRGASSFVDASNSDSVIEHGHDLRLGNACMNLGADQHGVCFGSRRIDAVLREDASDDLVCDPVSLADGRDRISVTEGLNDGGGGKACLISAHGDAALFEGKEDDVVADAVLASEIASGLTGKVFLDEIVSVSRVKFSGHVYNLETERGFYAANGIVTHNCRSTTVPVLTSAWEALGLSKSDIEPSTQASMDGQVAGDINYGQWLKGKPAAFQDEVLGAERGKLFRSGGITVDRFADSRGREYTLDELRKRDAAAFERVGL